MHPILYNKFQGKARKIFKKFYQMCNVERISGELKKASPFFVRSDCRKANHLSKRCYLAENSKRLRLFSCAPTVAKRCTSRKDVVSRSTQKGFAFFRALRLSRNTAIKKGSAASKLAQNHFYLVTPLVAYPTI